MNHDHYAAPSMWRAVPGHDGWFERRDGLGRIAALVTRSGWIVRVHGKTAAHGPQAGVDGRAAADAAARALGVL